MDGRRGSSNNFSSFWAADPGDGDGTAGSCFHEPEQPLTEGGLEKLCLDRVLVVVLANHSETLVIEQQPLSLQRGLCDRRKKQPAPLIELGKEFLGTQHGAGR